MSTDAVYPLESSIERTNSMMREEFKFSNQKQYWRTYGRLKDKLGLFEHKYNLEIDSSEWMKIVEETVLCIKNLFYSHIEIECQET